MQYSPWADAAERYPDIQIERCDIAPVNGAWVPSERVILIDAKLDRSGRRAALAHELCHVDLGHTPADGWFGRRMEREADTLAAQRLLADVAVLADAIAEQPLQPGLIAQQLDVPLRMLRRRLENLTAEEKRAIEERVAATERAC